MKKGIVIAGFSGIGKTELAKKYKNVIDLDSAPYVYDDTNMLHIPFEKRKGEIRKKNPNWPNNYIQKIKEVIHMYDLILVWDREDIINEYMKNEIEFIVCYPDYDDLNNYINRFKKRGNTEKYINMKLEQYHNRISFYKKLNVKKIILSNNETLEDYLIENNFNLILK